MAVMSLDKAREVAGKVIENLVHYPLERPYHKFRKEDVETIALALVMAQEQALRGETSPQTSKNSAL